jgi:hypothetical protein
LTNEFDDHERRKGIANVFWNQCSLVRRKTVRGEITRLPTSVLTDFNAALS